MKILKGFALAILGILLFFSLSVFGLAFMLNSTILNPDFVAREMDRINISSLIEEPLSEAIAQEGLSPEFKVALFSAVTELEPAVKKQVAAATYPIYDYLRGKRQGLDLALVLRNTILSPDFIASLVDRLDISSLAGEIIAEQISGKIPPDMSGLVDSVDDVIADIEPWLKEQTGLVAGPVIDYLLGRSQSLNVVISLEPLVDSLRTAFLKSPPTELAGLTQLQLEQSFNDYIGGVIPPTFVIDESTVGPEVPQQIASALAEGEDGLAQARQYVGYFLLGYKILIGLILLLILGIVLINREVRGATRGLGITFFTCGVITYLGNLAAKHFAGALLTQAAVPAQFQTYLPQLLADFLAPLDMYGIILAAIGAVLLIVSFAYKPRQSSL